MRMTPARRIASMRCRSGKRRFPRCGDGSVRTGGAAVKRSLAAAAGQVKDAAQQSVVIRLPRQDGAILNAAFGAPG